MVLHAKMIFTSESLQVAGTLTPSLLGPLSKPLLWKSCQLGRHAISGAIIGTTLGLRPVFRAQTVVEARRSARNKFNSTLESASRELRRTMIQVTSSSGSGSKLCKATPTFWEIALISRPSQQLTHMLWKVLSRS